MTDEIGRRKSKMATEKQELDVSTEVDFSVVEDSF